MHVDIPAAVESVFSRTNATRDDDEEALRWAALERLDTFERLRTTMAHKVTGSLDHIDVKKISPQERQHLVNKVLQLTEDHQEPFLMKLRKRIDRVGIKLPTIEVRFEDVHIDATCYVGSRALPTLFNTAQIFLEGILDMVCLRPSKKKVFNILHNVSGVIKPSRMTLLLGPPGSGKTTLLLALAGKLDKDLQVRGKVTYNGHTLDEFVPQKTAAYISQNDLHVGLMTVRETLNFSAQCQGIGTRYELLSELTKREKQAGIHPEPEVDFFMKATSFHGAKSSIATDYTLRILQLDHCANTLVGDEMNRGISGGQKKRVTTGEMIVGPTRVLLMDEISTGLDSSTTFQIVKSLHQFAHMMSGTVLMSLLQPAPETFDLFDDIILLSEGQILYHGPCEDVLVFFEECGFKCPERKGVADFLQEVISQNDQQQYWADRHRPYNFVSPRKFKKLFKSFHAGLQLKKELQRPFPKKRSHRAALAHQWYSMSNWDMFQATFAKEWLLMKRNSFVHLFMFIQLAVMAFVASTVFFRSKLHHETWSDGMLYMGALFFSCIVIMFNGFGELVMIIGRLPVFYKQRDLLFFPAWTFSLSNFILGIPLSVANATIWTCVTYYLTGYAKEPTRFFKYYLLMVILNMMASAMFRFVAAVCRTMIVAFTGGSLALLIVFMLGGFIIPRPAIKPWWIWGYWISPLAYAENAISINEMLSSDWRKPLQNSNNTLGQQLLISHGIYPKSYYYWICTGALASFMFLFNIFYTVALAYLSPPGKTRTVMSEEALAEKHLNRTGEPLGAGLYHTPSCSSGGSSDVELHKFRQSLGQFSVPDPEEEIVTSYKTQVAMKKVNKKRNSMLLPFQPLTLTFLNVQYYVDMPAQMKKRGMDNKLQLLQDVTGSFRPGVLTALIGVSGAGKTTLMDVLAGRKTGGYVEGDIRISGFPKRQATFTRIAGYCEQNDIHSPQVTVFESLVYSATLRLPQEIKMDSKMRFVEEVMELVELKAIRDSLVGLPGLTGLSTEQRKRLTIAVELVANPSVIFMDEPTSGLDARAAAIVMRTVRNTVDTGRTVVCTIHQPSTEIFEAFDEMLLMKLGGQVIYMGPLGYESCELIEYFEAIPGVPRIMEGYNPATWILEISSAAMETQLGVDFGELYRNSSLHEQNMTLVKELSNPVSGSQDLYFPSHYSQSILGQLGACLWKQQLTYWRSPTYNLVRFSFSAITAILFGTIFWDTGRQHDTTQNLFTVMGASYAAAIFLGINNAGTVQPVIAIERTVFYRERGAGMYSAIPYALAQVLIELPYVIFQTVIYSSITYAMVNFEWTAVKFCWYMYFMFITFITFTYYGMMWVSLSPNSEIASVIAGFFYSFFNVFSGFFIPRPQLPGWWVWYSYICPLAWVMNGLVTSQFGDISTPIDQPEYEGHPQSVQEWLASYFDFHYEKLPLVASVALALALLFAVIYIMAIKFLNFQHR